MVKMQQSCQYGYRQVIGIYLVQNLQMIQTLAREVGRGRLEELCWSVA